MLTEETTLQPGLYHLPDDPVGPKILIPGFRSAISVRGAFGWFTAGWIERLSPGLAEYLNRTDTSEIEFTVAPTFFPREREVIDTAHQMTAEEAEDRIRKIFTEGKVEASALGRHALDCLAWMLATQQLHLRIAVPKPTSNYHPKIWLFDDGDNQVLARGSGNATGYGTALGVEHLDVDVSWAEYSCERVSEGITLLDNWSQGLSSGIDFVLELSEALKQDIIKTAPETAPKISNYIDAAKEFGNPTWAIDPLEALRKRFSTPTKATKPRLEIPKSLIWQTGDYAHQGKAVTAWESQSEPERGTISMATGAGKSLTALICATRVQDGIGDAPFLLVISAPSVPLIEQWQKEVKRFGISAITPTLESDTNLALTKFFRSITSGGTHVMIVTNNLLTSTEFQATVSMKIQNKTKPIANMLIADEAHTLGTEGFINNKPEFFQRRIALSATPEREHDKDGTEEIFEFFGPPIYEFGLDKAIGFCLAPYSYYVHACTLNENEFEKFIELSSRIAAMSYSNDSEDSKVSENLTRLLIARRRIVETAKAKLALLKEVLIHREPHQLENVLIYSSSKDPQQFNEIGKILNDLDIRWSYVTQETTRNRKQLVQTIETFKKGGYQVLLAKKVLDEGVDIPCIREAFIVASSTVQREWIQRRGRVLRRHPEKPWAIIHDFLALPPSQYINSEASKSSKGIIQTEINRAYIFAAHSQTSVNQNGTFKQLEKIEKAYWPNGNSTTILKRPGDLIIAPSTPRGKPW